MKKHPQWRDEVLTEIERIRQIYFDVRQRRTRQVELLGKKCDAQILYTFLGFEVKMGRQRLTCPDMVSARYLRIFGELGMGQVLIPYDPTQTALILDGLEPALDRIKELLLQAELDRSAHQRALRQIYKMIRQQLSEEPSTGALSGP